jgi:hypothetical protein
MKRWILSGGLLGAVLLTVGLLVAYEPLSASRPTSLYELVTSNGQLYTFGAAPSFAPRPAPKLDGSVVAVADTPDGGGYWMATDAGAVYAFGNAHFFGSHTGATDGPVVGMAVTHDGGGYWLVTARGAVYSFGDAVMRGSMENQPLTHSIVGIAVTHNGGGYWLVASDGGIFTFGDAPFMGSMGGKHLNRPVVGMAPTDDGAGYWLVASDGGIFTFGDAVFRGSMGGRSLAEPVVGMAASPGAGGYWLVASDGGIFSFDAPFYGSMGGSLASGHVVGMVSAPAPPSHGSPPGPPPTSHNYPPAISSFDASSNVPAGGGASSLDWSTTNASSCTLSATPEIAGMDTSVACGSSGTTVSLPANTTMSPVTYTFELEARGEAAPDATASTQTTVVVAAPNIESLDSPASVTWTGGSAMIHWSTAFARSCTLSASPAISGLPSHVPCSQGTRSVAVPANSTTHEVGYTFTLDARGVVSPDAVATTRTSLSAPPKLLVSVTPNPLTETGAGEVHAVVQVSTSPGLEGDLVMISSPSLDAACTGGVTFTSISAGTTEPLTGDPQAVHLDGEGNATVTVSASRCSAGKALFEADLIGAPYYSATTTLDVLPPEATSRGVSPSPGSEIETGNTDESGEGDIYAVFNVETSAVYAEQSVEIQASQLVDRCGLGSYWLSNQGASSTDGTAAGSSSTWTAQLDDTGSATFEFFGASCASGNSIVLASVEAGLHVEYSADFTVKAPRWVIPR